MMRDVAGRHPAVVDNGRARAVSGELETDR
jgi:hypothetical protein